MSLYACHSKYSIDKGLRVCLVISSNTVDSRGELNRVKRALNVSIELTSGSDVGGGRRLRPVVSSASMVCVFLGEKREWVLWNKLPTLQCTINMPFDADLNTTMDVLQDLIDEPEWFAKNEAAGKMIKELCTKVSAIKAPSCDTGCCGGHSHEHDHEQGKGCGRAKDPIADEAPPTPPSAPSAPKIEDDGLFEEESQDTPPAFANAPDSDVDKLDDAQFGELQDAVTAAKSQAAEASSAEEKVECFTKAIEVRLDEELKTAGAATAKALYRLLT